MTEEEKFLWEIESTIPINTQMIRKRLIADMEKMLISGWKVKPAATYSLQFYEELREVRQLQKKSLKLAEFGS